MVEQSKESGRTVALGLVSVQAAIGEGFQVDVDIVETKQLGLRASRPPGRRLGRRRGRLCSGRGFAGGHHRHDPVAVHRHVSHAWCIEESPSFGRRYEGDSSLRAESNRMERMGDIE